MTSRDWSDGEHQNSDGKAKSNRNCQNKRVVKPRIGVESEKSLGRNGDPAADVDEKRCGNELRNHGLTVDSREEAVETRLFAVDFLFWVWVDHGE